jgi:hypothetical protein
MRASQSLLSGRASVPALRYLDGGHRELAYECRRIQSAMRSKD